MIFKTSKWTKMHKRRENDPKKWVKEIEKLKKCLAMINE